MTEMVQVSLENGHLIKNSKNDVSTHSVMKNNRGEIVCYVCGMVLGKTYVSSRSRAQYSAPFQRGNYTKVGRENNKKIKSNSNLKRLRKLNVYRNRDTEEEVRVAAKRVAKMVIGNMQLSKDYIEILIHQYMNIRKKIPLESKYKSPNIMVPFLICLNLKLDRVLIDKDIIFEHSELNPKLYKNLLSFITKYNLNFLGKKFYRTKIEIIKEQLFECGRDLNFKKNFYDDACTILENTYHNLLGGTVNIICASIARIAACYEMEERKEKQILSYFDVNQSAVQVYLKKRLFSLFRVPGFTTLKKSPIAFRRLFHKAKKGLTSRRSWKFRSRSVVYFTSHTYYLIYSTFIIYLFRISWSLGELIQYHFYIFMIFTGKDPP